MQMNTASWKPVGLLSLYPLKPVLDMPQNLQGLFVKHPNTDFGLRQRAWMIHLRN